MYLINKISVDGNILNTGTQFWTDDLMVSDVLNLKCCITSKIFYLQRLLCVHVRLIHINECVVIEV